MTVMYLLLAANVIVWLVCRWIARRIPTRVALTVLAESASKWQDAGWVPMFFLRLEGRFELWFRAPHSEQIEVLRVRLP